MRFATLALLGAVAVKANEEEEAVEEAVEEIEEAIEEVADAIGEAFTVAGWKIGIALTNLIPCTTPLLGPDCSAGVQEVEEGPTVVGYCGTATMPSGVTGADYVDADFTVVGCFPATHCGSTSVQIPGTTSEGLVYKLDCDGYVWDGATKLAASAVALAAVALNM